VLQCVAISTLIASYMKRAAACVLQCVAVMLPAVQEKEFSTKIVWLAVNREEKQS